MPPVDQFLDVFVVDEFTAIGGGNALFDFPKKPFVIVDHALDGFHYEGLAIAAMFGDEADKLFLEFGIQSYFHEFE